MSKKKFVKLINSERTNKNIISGKANDNICTKVDIAYCSGYSYDICEKDYAACDGTSYDYCERIDLDGCINSSYDYN